MYKNFLLIAIFILSASIAGSGQTTRKTQAPKPSPKPAVQPSLIIEPMQTAPPANIPPPVTLETILSEAAKQTDNYRLTFKDLLANETKTFESFDSDGNSKNQTVVDSDFLVYQSAKDERITSELRNVTKVDGKLVPDSQARSQRLFAELQKTKTIESELEKIQKESARYDKTLDIDGLTLFEGGVLQEDLRPYFDFKIEDSGNEQGSDVFVISYRQTKKSPYVVINGKEMEEAQATYSFRFDVPDELKNSDIFLDGKLWIDKQTYQIRREEREVIIQSSAPINALSFEFNYQPSEYGILVPKQILLTSNKIRRDKESGEYKAVADVKVTYDYSKFRKTNTDVKIIDEN